MTNFRFSSLAALLGLAFVIVSAQSALADSIVLVGPKVIPGFGFGHNPRALTIQSNGGPHQKAESGCIAPNGTGLTPGNGHLLNNSACANTTLAKGGDEQNPLGSPKQAAPTLSSLNITKGSQIGILFDAIQAQSNNEVTIDDLTLKLYNGASLVYSVSASFNPLAGFPAGNGKSNYLFVLDSAATTAFDAALNKNYGDRIALDSTISFPSHTSGPDSYALFNNAPILPSPSPEPTSMLLLGSSIVALVARKGLRKAQVTA